MTSTELAKLYNSFQTKWLGKRVDTDGVPKGAVYQCVDLIKQYAKEVFNLTPGSWGNAVNYWYYTAPVLFTKFDKIATTNVKKGDIVILKPVDSLERHKAGHITLATGNQTSTTYEALEQNGYNGSGSGTGGNAIRTRNIVKTRILGVLRPKVVVPQPAYRMPKINSRIQLIPVDLRTTYKNGTDTVAGRIRVNNNSYIYFVRAYDKRYKNRIIINSKSGGGNGVALALYYKDGKRITGWKQL